jgi:hypothetical protein
MVHSVAKYFFFRSDVDFSGNNPSPNVFLCTQKPHPNRFGKVMCPIQAAGLSEGRYLERKGCAQQTRDSHGARII